jgi:hypothetical protein
VNPLDNPYTPNAGARPPALVGREAELEQFKILLARLTHGRTGQSMLVTGLRGVGKTVLLNAFEEIVANANWHGFDVEIRRGDAFGPRIALLARRALLTLAPPGGFGERARRALSVLKSFTVTVSPEGSFTAGLGLDVEQSLGIADSGNLSDDLTDLFVALGEAARERETGIAFLFDEVQFLEQVEFEALIAALHKTVQRSLPITLVGAGLPQLPKLAGEAKSYAERLFKFPRIGQLSPVDTDTALRAPAEAQGVTFADGAIEHIAAYTEGYPYFLQEYGAIVWDMAPEGEAISLETVRRAQPHVEAHLDQSFFHVRAERTTKLQLTYLRAMAELGAGPHASGEVAEKMHRGVQQLGPTRAGLIDKGLLWTPAYGMTAFTVPQFDRFMRRTYPLDL